MQQHKHTLKQLKNELQICSSQQLEELKELIEEIFKERNWK